MSLSRLWTRVTRLEQQASSLLWYDDLLPFYDEVLRQASNAVGLTPPMVEEMCTALQDMLRDLGRRFPSCLTDEQVSSEVMAAITSAIRSFLDRHVADSGTRRRLKGQIGQILKARAEAEREESVKPG